MTAPAVTEREVPLCQRRLAVLRHDPTSLATEVLVFTRPRGAEPIGRGRQVVDRSGGLHFEGDPQAALAMAQLQVLSDAWHRDESVQAMCRELEWSQRDFFATLADFADLPAERRREMLRPLPAVARRALGRLVQQLLARGRSA